MDFPGDQRLRLQVRFPQAVCLTGVKVGAVPTKLASGEPASVDIFAADLATLGAARFACLAESCTLPESGTRAVRLEVEKMLCKADFPAGKP